MRLRLKWIGKRAAAGIVNLLCMSFALFFLWGRAYNSHGILLPQAVEKGEILFCVGEYGQKSVFSTKEGAQL